MMHKKAAMMIGMISILLINGCSTTSPAKRKFTRTFKCPVHHVELKEVPVIYGFPDEELLQKAEKGEVILGGCVPGEYNYAYICPIDRKIFKRIKK